MMQFSGQVGKKDQRFTSPTVVVLIVFFVNLGMLGVIKRSILQEDKV